MQGVTRTELVPGHRSGNMTTTVSPMNQQEHPSELKVVLSRLNSSVVVMVYCGVP